MTLTKTALFTLLSLVAIAGCGSNVPAAKSPTGETLQADKVMSGKVTGAKVGAQTKVAVFGAFTNISGNKIDASNNTIDKDGVLALAPVKDGAYRFALPKGPQKAHAALFKVFAFNDDNDNGTYEDNEVKSKEASLIWSVVGGYTAAQDADGNKIVDLFSEFKDFNYKLD